MRGFLPVLVGAVGGLGVLASVASAEATCAGNACAVVTLSADGCRWANTGNKSVRLSFSTGGVVRMVTVLAPGAAYWEPQKTFCATGGEAHYDASFAALGTASPEPPKAQAARAKPSVTTAAPSVAVQPVAAEVAVASVEAAVPLPRAKPKPPPVYPPLPRAKPEAPVTTAAAPAAAVAPAAAAIEPATAEASLDACGDDCPPILFKVVDDCVWVLNLNPRPVAFAAEAGGKRLTLKLEAADGAKADARAAAIAAGKAANDEAALHMRLKDPFQTAGSGIPVYRARLGSPGACVRSRAEITRFQANYVR